MKVLTEQRKREMVVTLTALNHKLTSFQRSSTSSAELSPTLNKSPHIHSGVLRPASFNNSAVSSFLLRWPTRLGSKHLPTGACKHAQCFTFERHNNETALQCGWLVGQVDVSISL